MQKLLQFNAFGLVKVTDYEVTVTITAITSEGKAIKRVLLEEFEKPLHLFGTSEFATATFAAFIQPSGKSRIAYNDLGIAENVPLVGDIPGISDIMIRAIELVRIACKGSSLGSSN